MEVICGMLFVFSQVCSGQLHPISGSSACGLASLWLEHLTENSLTSLTSLLLKLTNNEE